MPWQQQVYDVIGELLTEEECEEMGVPFGTPAYRSVLVTVPRQSGKSTLLMVCMIDRCMHWPVFNSRAPQVLYTAQSGKAARKKVLEDMVPAMLGSKWISRQMGRVLKGVGSEKVPFLTGSNIFVGNSTESAGHGETLDLFVADEFFDDDDDRREQAAIPAMATRPHGQILYSSTAGTVASISLNTKVKQGRKAVKADKGTGLAYFEFAAPADTVDVYCEDLWRRVHPALGYTVSISTMRHAAETMEEKEFSRAWLNIAITGSAAQHLPEVDWATVCVEGASAQGDGPKTWAVDMSQDRTHCAIALYNHDSAVGELVDYGVGSEWVADRITELQQKWGGSVVTHRDGPGASLAQPDWELVGNHDFFTNCGKFYDLVVNHDLKIRPSGPLNDAVKAGHIRRSGDRWGWSRSASRGDISPLIAMTLAASNTPQESGLVAPFIL